MTDSDLHIRRARESDLSELIRLFEEDEHGGHGDTSDEHAYDDYVKAFHIIDQSLNEQLYVAEQGGEVVASFQLAFLRTLRGRGGLTGVIEAVHTRSDKRGQGIGSKLLEFAVSEAKRRGCRLVQITHRSDRDGTRAFYERAGFSPDYTGFRMHFK
ncbi:GNAT family N-acetyltransferase [Rhizobium lemnae]|uniref:GNAT family N-acetyltransferase n=1 Tax=Rhizobium lemnae TaxID=1214924 RepID=A0ABV8E7I4_9HYPH|nr:GNAT family N-acetyltransferase [Rhizobium lemnae]MCJ8508355.1 GNAT family N-acetyltransferase [Rhizobium lemnae]